MGNFADNHDEFSRLTYYCRYDSLRSPGCSVGRERDVLLRLISFFEHWFIFIIYKLYKIHFQYQYLNISNIHSTSLFYLFRFDFDCLLSFWGAPLRIRQALVWVFLSRGIPILYYGTEQGLDGHQGPENSKGQDNLRESMWHTGRANTFFRANRLGKAKSESGDGRRCQGLVRLWIWQLLCTKAIVQIPGNIASYRGWCFGVIVVHFPVPLKVIFSSLDFKLRVFVCNSGFIMWYIYII
jgi:hypothetical protein